MPTVGLCIVDTVSHVLANNAVRLSMARHGFDDLYIFTDDPAKFDRQDKVILIDRIRSIEAYNAFVIKELPEYVSTDYVVIAQYDGFVLNGSEWSGLYLHYDYIGAPWGERVFPEFRVGNGGFSLRSKRLLQALSRLPYDPRVPEDVFVCRYQRALLEQEFGMRFAPLGIAAHFSVEEIPVAFPTFGFHGLFWLPAVYGKRLDFLLENLPAQILHDPRLAQGFRRLGAEGLRQLQLRRSVLPRPVPDPGRGGGE